MESHINFILKRNPQDYIDDCRQNAQQQVAAYNSLAAAIGATNQKTDKTIKYKPDKSILKYNLDDVIKLSKDDFLHLAETFFADIERKFL
ncbi:hypothetical protein [Paenibacillus terrigena]|uniref:hypothetical protein n=1 Tax=Paenibacillus terrigena TaxID=369333 RepID=UPI0028D66D52|nr:hypothetical protein [Paenibacillus terrigena]